MFNMAIQFFAWVHNLSYKVLTKLAIKKNNGVHPKHNIMNYHRFFVDNVGDTDEVLDIGCGNGLVAYDVADKAKKVVGIDIKDSNIEKTRKLSFKIQYLL